MRPASYLALLSALLATATGCPAVAQERVRGVPRVVDGDTLEVAGTSIRLWGIDAPESRQACERDGISYACGSEAAAFLRTLIAGASVECEVRTKDRYQRSVAVCRCEGVDVGAVMVRAGWAVAFTRYSGDYEIQEREARAERIGLWAGSFSMPWAWRAKAH